MVLRISRGGTVLILDLHQAVGQYTANHTWTLVLEKLYSKKCQWPASRLCFFFQSTHLGSSHDDLTNPNQRFRKQKYPRHPMFSRTKVCKNSCCMPSLYTLDAIHPTLKKRTHSESNHTYFSGVVPKCAYIMTSPVHFWVENNHCFLLHLNAGCSIRNPIIDYDNPQ